MLHTSEVREEVNHVNTCIATQSIIKPTPGYHHVVEFVEITVMSGNTKFAHVMNRHVPTNCI
jgi:hypothetical protein